MDKLTRLLKAIAQTIAIIALVAAVIFIFIWVKKMKLATDEALATIKIYREQPVEVVSVVRSELRTLYPYVDSLIQAAGLNEKHIETITNIHHEYKWDTIPAIITPDSGRQVLTVEMEKACFRATGIIDFSATNVKLSDEDIDRLKFHLTGVSVTDTTTTVYYYQRKIKKIFFIPLRIGRKQYFSETFSKCEATTKTESINLIKR